MPYALLLLHGSLSTVVVPDTEHPASAERVHAGSRMCHTRKNHPQRSHVHLSVDKPPRICGNAQRKTSSGVPCRTVTAMGPADMPGSCLPDCINGTGRSIDAIYLPCVAFALIVVRRALDTNVLVHERLGNVHHSGHKISSGICIAVWAADAQPRIEGSADASQAEP